MTSMKWDLDTALEVTRREGIEQGIEQGREQGREQGKKSGRWETLTELVKDGMSSLRDAAKKAGMTEAEFRKAAMLRSDGGAVSFARQSRAKCAMLKKTDRENR